MKTVVAIKDSYQGKSVRIFYVQKNAVVKEKRLKPLAEIPQDLLAAASAAPLPFTSPALQATIEGFYEEVEVEKDIGLDCERLYWNEQESELDEQIESRRAELESLSSVPSVVNPLPAH